MGKWADGRALSKKCWALLKSNRYFLWFPILGLFLSLVPIVLSGLLMGVAVALGVVWSVWVIGFIGLVFINFAFVIAGAALVASIDEELAGRESSLGYGFTKAFGRLGPLFTWSIIRAIVSSILGAIRSEGGGGVGALITNLVASAGAAAWSIITFFVTPCIMLGGESAVPAIKKSSHIVKEKWGTQVAGGVRIGLGVALIIIPGVLILVGGFMLANISGPAALAVIGLGALIILFGILISSALKAIFSVALYRFANDESELGPFTGQELSAVLTSKQ